MNPKSLLTACALACSAALPVAAEPAPAAKFSRDYFAHAKVGMFVHYALGSYADGHYGGTWTSPQGKPAEDLQALANGLDVNAMADVARSMGAQYFIFTAWHAGINLLYPSKVWGEVFPEKVARRDLVGDLADALAVRGIPLILYVHPDDRHDLNDAEYKRLVAHRMASVTDRDRKKPDYRADALWLATYVRLIDELGARYGTRIRGFWQDGSTRDPAGVKAAVERHVPDYSFWNNGGSSVPPATFIGSEYPEQQRQWAATFGAGWWGSRGKVKMTPAEMFQKTILWAATKGQLHGGIAWSAGPFVNNAWLEGVLSNFKELGDLLRASGSSIFDTVPSAAFVTDPKTGQKQDWGAATDARDGRAVFLHVMHPPEGAVLRIGQAADRRFFDEATLVPSGRPLALAATPDGYTITLPAGQSWETVNTIIRLRVKQ